MRIVLIMVLFYLGLGFVLGSGDSISSLFQSNSKVQRSGFEIAAQLAFPAMFLCLPAIGVVQAKKQGTFFKLSAALWVLIPLISLIIGLVAGRFLK